MTKEDWEKVEKALGGLYGFAKLTVDGREIQFQRQLVDKNKLGIVTYIDGHFLGAWIMGTEEHPEQKFLRKIEKFVYPEKLRNVGIDCRNAGRKNGDSILTEKATISHRSGRQPPRSAAITRKLSPA